MPESLPNKRGAERVEVLGHAVVTAPGLRANCVIRDISTTGAKLGVSRQVRLPAAFDLWLMKTRTKRRVLVRWRRGDFVGVEFCQRMTATTTTETSEEQQDIWIV
jgi:hypothetical protein